MERKLLKPQDYERFQGKKAKITLREPVDGRRNWEGTLAGYRRRRRSARNRTGQDPSSFPFEQVQKANLKFEW